MDIAISLVGGLGLFLYGMSLMGDGLQKSAGDKLKRIIELLTSNIIIGVLVGTVVTAIIQSSSATTVMVVGFVNAGIMGLSQAIGVIMGANIGTTITAQLISFKLEGLAPITLGIGIILYLFAPNSKVKNISEILLGFGILFTGMEFMKEAVEPLAEFKGFTDALIMFGKQPLLGLLTGFVITAIVQSSSAAMGMLIALAAQGIIPLPSALPILYGQNIGTCVTSLVSSVGANRNAKRAAIMHLLFNVLGTIIFLIFLNKPVVALVTKINPNDVARQLANTHTLFNILSVLLLLPFAKIIVKIAMKIIPGEKDENSRSTYLDERILETPSIALGNTIKETVEMAYVAKESLNNAMDGFLNKKSKSIEKVREQEVEVNLYQRNLLDYLLKLSKSSLPGELIEEVDNLFNTINDIERIGDHSENISELATIAINKDIVVSPSARDEINSMYEKIIESYEIIIKVLEDRNIELSSKVYVNEIEIIEIGKSIRSNHLNRLNNSECTIDSGILYLELISNLERISYHGCNIARRI